MSTEDQPGTTPEAPKGARLVQAGHVVAGQWVEMGPMDESFRAALADAGHYTPIPVGTWLQVTELRVGGGGSVIMYSDALPMCIGLRFHHRTEIVVSDDPDGVAPRTAAPDWDDYFLGIAQAVAARAKCRRRKVGAVIVGPDHRIMSTGYNGAPSGMLDCLEGGCPRGLSAAGSVAARSPYDDPTSPGYCPALHAEHNAVVYAGKDVHGATCYTTDAPCPGCTKTLAGAGVSRVVWKTADGEMRSGEPAKMLAARKVEVD